MAELGIGFRHIEIHDILFVNMVRNSCTEFLHNPQKYSFQETTEWFWKTHPKWFMISISPYGIVGYFRMTMENNKWFIGMDLHEKYRGMGYGELLYKMFMPFAYYITQTNELWLKVLKTNSRAIHLYEKLGFKFVEEEIIDRAGKEEISLTYKLIKNG